MNSKKICGALALSAVLSASLPSDAATRTVTSTADSGAGSLRSEISAAISNDTIIFDSGIYNQTIVLSSQIAIDKNLTIDGTGAGMTVSGGSATRLFYVYSSSSSLTVTMKYLTISDGRATSDGNGGGIYNRENLVIQHCTLSNNVNERSGGDSRGGAVYSDIGSLTIENSVISGNSAAHDSEALPSYGGAIYCTNGSALTISYSTISNNQAKTSSGASDTAQGGAIYLNSSSMTAAYSSFSGNSAGTGAENASGGAIYWSGGSSTHNISYCTFSGNSVSASGSGAVYGGAIYLQPFSGAYTAVMNLSNCTFSGNQISYASGTGIARGGVAYLNCFSPATVSINFYNCTLAGNSSSAASVNNGVGGAVNLVSSIGVAMNSYSTIFGDNSCSNPTGGQNISKGANAVISNAEYNLVETSDGNHGITNGVNGNIVGIDPALNSLADNGGLTQTRALQATSPGINAGSNPQSFTTDQRGPGFVRTFGAGTDIGAFELQTKTWDINGDGKSDVVADDSATYYGYLYLMNGATPSASDNIYRNTNPDWSVAGIADFNGDFKSDLIWQSASTGKSIIYLMNGFTVLSVGTIYNGGTGWGLDKLGDFNGDGKTDILWKHPVSGQGVIYIMNGTSVSDFGTVTRGLNWTAKSTGDFNGDGKADILWEIGSSPITGQLYLMNGKNVSSQGQIYDRSATWLPQFFADFNGDGKCDILWRDTVAKAGYMYLMNGTSITSKGYVYTTPPASEGWTVIQSGDFNADGKSDLLWQNSLTGQGSVWLMNGLTMLSSGMPYVVTNSDWQVLRLLDFNGDSKADILWQNSSSLKALDYIMNGVSIHTSGTVFGSGNRTILDPALKK